MAKDKKKEKQIIEHQKPTKIDFEVNLEFANFRIIKADKLNYAIEKRYSEGKKKGEWSANTRAFYPTLSLALESAFDKMDFTEKEGRKIKKMMKAIEGFKSEILKAIEELQKRLTLT